MSPVAAEILACDQAQARAARLTLRNRAGLVDDNEAGDFASLIILGLGLMAAIVGSTVFVALFPDLAASIALGLFGLTL